MSVRGLHRTSSIPESRPVPYSPKCSPQEYAKAIAHHSKQSSGETLYPGLGYGTLKIFLEQELSHASSSTPSSTDDYAWLISTGQANSSDGQSLSDRHSVAEPADLGSQSEGFSIPEACIEAIKANIESLSPQILFLRGHPTPHWITSLGAFCYADPELFRWFLRYLEEPNSDYYFGSASSMMSNMFRFKFFTIGSTMRQYAASQSSIDAMRSRAASDMRDYQDKIRLSWVLRAGDSIVRDFHVLDVQHAVIEQEITVSVFDIGKTWMAIACTDAGNSIDKGPTIPTLRINYDPLPISLWLPIIQYRPRCALKSRGIQECVTTPRQIPNEQSLAVFPEGYGRGLDWARARSDRFHVLAETFRLSAFSQQQLLNLLQRKIKTETSHLLLNSENPTLANLMYFRELLQDQHSYATYMMALTSPHATIFRTGSGPGRRSNVGTPGEGSKIAPDYSMAEVHSMFQDIQLQAQGLQEKCTQVMAVISNSSMLAESQRAMKQAKLVTKLTVAAFVYLPFTFASGFFGMNFSQFGTGSLSLWIYFAASFPLLLVTLAFYALDKQSVRRGLQALRLMDAPKQD